MLGPLLQTYEVVESIQETDSEILLGVKHKRHGGLCTARISRLSKAPSPEFFEQFQAEALALRKLNHPHVAELHHIALTAEGHLVTVGEVSKGMGLKTLHDDQGPLPIPHIVSFTRQILDAVGSLHHAGFAPPVLTPEAITVRRDPSGRLQAEIHDLGLARTLQNRNQGGHPTLSSAEARYASPEQLQGAPNDGHSDAPSTLYSLGIVLYELLTGYYPLEATDIQQRLAAEPPSFETTDPEGRVPEVLRNVVLWMLSKAPIDRPQSTRQVEEALEASNQKTPWIRRWGWVAALAPIALAAGLYLGSRGDTKPKQTPSNPSETTAPAAPSPSDTSSNDPADSGRSVADPTAGSSTDSGAVDGGSGEDPLADDPSVDDPKADSLPSNSPLATHDSTPPDRPSPNDDPSIGEPQGTNGTDASPPRVLDPPPFETEVLPSRGTDPPAVSGGEPGPGNGGTRSAFSNRPNDAASGVNRAPGSAPGVVVDVGTPDATPPPPTDVAPRVVTPPTPPPPVVTPPPTRPAQAEASEPLEFLTVEDSSLLLKLVGLSDNIPVVPTPSSSETLFTMEPLKSYFVIEDNTSAYRIASEQSDGGLKGYVGKNKVTAWNTREGLHFIDSTFSQDRRRSVTAWETQSDIMNFLRTGDGKTYAPSFREQFQTRVGKRGIIPYPLLDTVEVDGPNGTRRIHQVLVPAIIQGTAEVDLDRTEVERVAGAVTFCVVFDATASMDKYARTFAKTIEDMLTGLQVDARLAAAGFVLFRDLKDGEPFEVVHPMPLTEATDWLLNRAKGMVGGDKPAEPVLDAVNLAQTSFLWNGGTAIRGADRIAIVVANDDAHPQTVGLKEDIPVGLDAKTIASNLLRRSAVPIKVFALQAGNKDGGNLINVLSTLARDTGGEFYPAADNSTKISSSFARRVNTLLQEQIAQGQATIAKLQSGIASSQDGGTVIALSILDDALKARLQTVASQLNITEGGFVVQEAWVIEDPTLYREKVLIEKELLENLLRFFNGLNDSALSTAALQATTASLLEALTGERLDPGAEIQELLEKRLGIHFTTNLLSFPLEQLALFGPEDLGLLQDGIHSSTIALADFLDMNSQRFDKEPRIWMPVSYLP